VHDPVASVVMQATLADIDAVMVAGRWRKRDGQLLEADIPAKLERLRRSGRRIVAALALNDN
jgi:hypothetical protein